MTINIRYAVLAVLTISVLLVLALTNPAPLLYSLQKDHFPSPFHENVDVLKQQSMNSTTDIAPLIQECIDLSGPVSLNLRIHNLEQARRDLERFEKSRGSLKNLIVRLDMNESEIQKIEQDAAKQQEILESLLNTSETIESLQLMEIQYYSQDNKDMLTTVRLRGDELRKKVQGLNERYNSTTESITRSGTKLGLDVTTNKESGETVSRVIREIEKPNATAQLQVDTKLIPGDDRVSLFIRPASGRYRDTIEYMGISLTLQGNTTLREENKPITLFLDDSPVSTIQTDMFGYYNVKLPIERIPSGAHTVYARSNTSRSVNRTLVVLPVDSTTNLSVRRQDQTGNVSCIGFVMANRPVASASIQIVWDQTHVIVTKTDAGGGFIKDIQLPPGSHTIIAEFYGDGYPVNPSKSEPQVVEISLLGGLETDFGYLPLVIAAVGIIVLFCAGAVFYLRRMTQRKSISSAAVPAADFLFEDTPESARGRINLHAPAHEEEVTPVDLMKSGNETLIAYYTRILGNRGLGTASRYVYQYLAGHVARDLHIKRHKTLTARELGRNCKGKRYCGAFARFISAYERIRYSGQASTKDQTVFETAMNITDEQMEGESH